MVSPKQAASRSRRKRIPNPRYAESSIKGTKQQALQQEPPRAGETAGKRLRKEIVRKMMQQKEQNLRGSRTSREKERSSSNESDREDGSNDEEVEEDEILEEGDGNFNSDTPE